MSDSKNTYRIVVLGAGAVGKSALTLRLINDKFLKQYDPTIEDNYKKQTTVDNSPALLDILDTAGQEEFVTMKSEWFREGEGFILVYSITKEESLVKDAAKFHDEIISEKGTANFPMILVGNKCDLSDEREVPTEKGQKMANSWHCPFFETSAKEKINVEMVFEECVREIRKNRNEKEKGDTATQETKGGCCAVL